MATVRNAYILPPEKVNYGITDNLAPPYISVMEFESTQVYDTSGATIRESDFSVLIIDKSQDDAETIATTVNTLIDTSTSLTPQCMRCLQEKYEVGQMEERAYQFGVKIKYHLIEDMKI